MVSKLITTNLCLIFPLLRKKCRLFTILNFCVASFCHNYSLTFDCFLRYVEEHCLAVITHVNKFAILVPVENVLELGNGPVHVKRQVRNFFSWLSYWTHLFDVLTRLHKDKMRLRNIKLKQNIVTQFYKYFLQLMVIQGTPESALQIT